MFRKVMIANRGEIAVRIAKTIQEMGLQAVAVYSQPDAQACHVHQADIALPLEGVSAADTYLNMTKLIALAQSAGVDAIHPGYGFLSENAAFAEACQAAGITFIGPTPAVIAAMGDKIIAKQTMAQAGVPIVPGWSGDATTEDVATIADNIGYPVLVKAAAGGGGKGMRLVHRPADLADAMAAAAREAQHAFGDGRIFLEKYITHPRHVEIQVLGDHHGHWVHLFERECSIQRRHQKIIEESPSVALTPALREAMGQAALKAAQAIGYTNAGTVEFIVDAQGQFYFLEVNTRLQVEHPVTELVTGQDLVQLQLEIAMGKPLPFSQSDLIQRNHAIECRIYAEDPQRQFLPATGTLHGYQEPAGPGIRVDSGVRAGDTVSVHYDPMLAKLIVWGPNRPAVLAKMRWALQHYVVLGVTTNIEFLSAILAHPDFIAGEFDTQFLEHHDIQNQPTTDALALAESLAALVSAQPNTQSRQTQNSAGFTPMITPWETAGAWRG